MLAALYFPSLREPVRVVVAAHLAITKKCLSVAGRLAGVSDLVAIQAAHDDFLKDWPALYKAALDAVSALTDTASAIMQDLSGVSEKISS
jgi:hypothetical protein